MASDHVFCSKAFTPMESGHLRRSFRLALSKAKIEEFHFHDLRHTFATRLVQAGVDPVAAVAAATSTPAALLGLDHVHAPAAAAIHPRRSSAHFVAVQVDAVSSGFGSSRKLSATIFSEPSTPVR